MKINSNCHFCKKKIFKNIKVYNYNNYNVNSFFEECSECKILQKKNKKINALYGNLNNNINYNKKNIFFFLKIFLFFFYILRIWKFVNSKKNNNNFTILDYGCGSGELINALSFFVKSKLYAADFFLKKPYLIFNNIKYLNEKNILSNKFKNKFDVIILRHVFEHIIHPHDFLKKIAFILKKKGTLIIEVPNYYNSFWVKIFKKRWPGFFFPYHTFLYSQEFLVNFLINHNFKIQKTMRTEPPVFGSFLITLKFPRFFSKIFSILLFPLQFFASKFFLCSEAIIVIANKK
jgi:2-polyprenyl-3-methyl-5-hydroxy-6-metoxy-1,4-benzoquinol methylase